MKHIEYLLGQLEVPIPNRRHYGVEISEDAKNAIIEYVDRLENKVVALEYKIKTLQAKLKEKEGKN